MISAIKIGVDAEITASVKKAANCQLRDRIVCKDVGAYTSCGVGEEHIEHPSFTCISTHDKKVGACSDAGRRLTRGPHQCDKCHYSMISQ